MDNNDAKKLLTEFSGQYNFVGFPTIYENITGSVTAALLLNQIVYWSSRTKNEDGFFYKSYKDWKEEICLSKYQVKTAANKLEKLGFIEIKLVGTNPSPVNHYKPNFDNIAAAILNRKENQSLRNLTVKKLNGQSSRNLTVNRQETERLTVKKLNGSIYTENTTDITTKNTTYRDLDFSFVDDELKEAVKEFTEFRKNIKSPMTQKALVLLVNKLNKEGSNNEERIEMMNESIMNNWKSVYPLKKKSGWNQKKNDIDVDYGMDSLERWEQKHGKLFKG